jgi:GNAT superfamily N-acetyltransferase
MTTTLRPAADAHPLPDGQSQGFAICSNGRPVGSLLLAEHSGRGWISNLEVRAESRRRGHGSVAVLAAEEVLRSWGCRRALIDMPARSAAGRALAEALGYQLDRQRMIKRLPWRAPRLPEGTVVRPLHAEEYDDWLAAEVAEYSTVADVLGEEAAPAARERALAEYARVLPDGLATPGIVIRALDAGGERAGSLLLAFHARDVPDCGWVYHVVVGPGHRGKGYGRTLMLVAERECRAAGLRRCGLNVFAYNRPALTLYTSLGYVADLWVLSKAL